MLFLSIIIPAYNEERRLPGTLDTMLSYLSQRPDRSYEILIVNDGSTDSTKAFITREMERYPCIRLVDNPGNRGKGYSVRHGMLEAQGAWRLFSDADLSTPIEEIEKTLEAAERLRADIAIGSRALDRSLVAVHQSALREYSGRIFNLFMRMITGLQFLDTQCGFKLYSAAAARKIFPMQQLDGFGFDVEDLFIARIHRLETVEVAVRWSNVEGTKVSFLRGLESFLDVVRIRWFQLLGKYRAPKVPKAE